jgi:hypothetical protein
MISAILPRFYRQRYLLQFIEYAGESVTKIDLQKLLFLAQQQGKANYFDFVPYHYGCYSFQAAHDLEILENTGWIRTTKNDIQLQQSVDRDGFTKKGEKAEIRRFFNEHKRLRGTRLIKYVYERFPYYATKSKIAYQIMDKPPALEKYGDGETLYTLGYEGRSFEAYVNRLIKNGINVLCDVRKNPLSRKFGFSKGVMARLLPCLDISYIHIPELGIVSSQRIDLRVPSDYDELFITYKKSLPSKVKFVSIIHDLIDKKKNVALTCYEHEPRFCHRSHVAGFIEKKYSVNVNHL